MSVPFYQSGDLILQDEVVQGPAGIEAYFNLTRASVSNQRAEDVVPQFLLIGLCEPPGPEKQAQFDEWFVNQHIEDTTHCPNFIRGRVYKLAGPHLDGVTVSNYISVYEVEAPSYAEAERVLNAWQANPDAWPGRKKHLETAARMDGMPLKVVGSGWYEQLKSYAGPKA